MNSPISPNFRGPGKGLPPAGFELPPILAQARERNTLQLAIIRSDDPDFIDQKTRILGEMTVLHTGHSLTEQDAIVNDRLTAEIQRDFDRVSLDVWD